MAIPKVGLNTFRDACSDKVDTGVAGTGTTTPSVSDTALASPVSATELTASVTLGAQAFQTSHIVPSTVATGNAFTEWAILTTSDVLLSRSVTSSINHTSDDEITKITTFNLVDK